MVLFDHIEIHVLNPINYCDFLTKLLVGGRYKKISENETYMFISNDLHRFEIKQLKCKFQKQEIQSGFCMPCIRVSDARKHLADLAVTISAEIQNPDGPCLFFEDYEGIRWHIKSYDRLDDFVNF